MTRVTEVEKESLDRSALSGDVKSAARALEILELLAEYPDGLSLTDIGKHLDIPLSSLHGLINTLTNKGYAVRLESPLVYRLGPRLSQLASSYRAQTNLATLVQPVMERLRRITSETVSITLLQGDMIVFVHKLPAEGRVQIFNPIGTRLHAHATGSGKVMLAYLSEKELDTLFPMQTLPSLTPFTISTKNGLKAALADIREKGYACDNQESELGVWAVAGCIRNEEGSPIASVSVAAPLFRIQGKDHAAWSKLVRDGCAEISVMLGFCP